jgi:AAA15 family ATPase/GTPase
MIQNILIENFLNFKKFEAPRLASINLLIGDNDTGKTGLLKLLYAVSKTWEIYSRQYSHGSPSFKKVLSEKIFDTFQPRSRNKIGEFVTKGIKEKLKVEVTYQTGNNHQNISFQFGGTTKNTINHCTDSVAVMDDNNVIFIPAKEVLTAFRAIKFTREQHYLAGFDDTYLDLIRMLEVPMLDSDKIGRLNNINEQLETLLGGEIDQTDEDFLFKRGS